MCVVFLGLPAKVTEKRADWFSSVTSAQPGGSGGIENQLIEACLLL
jgi:hypothetical protein